MKYEEIEKGRRVVVTSGKHQGKAGLIADFWPPQEPTVILDIGGEYGISEVKLNDQEEGPITKAARKYIYKGAEELNPKRDGKER